MRKQTIATFVFVLLVTNYLSFQAGQTILFYKANGPARRPPMAATRVYGVNQVLQFETTRLDFGRLEGRAPVSRQVKFRNPGPQAVQISRIKTSCGCTAASTETMQVAAGGSGELKVTVNPASSSPELAVSISVEYEGKTPIDRLLVSGQVIK